MTRMSATTRIVLGLSCLTLSVLLIGTSLGLAPDEYGARMQGRSRLCEAIAVNGSLFVTRGDAAGLESCLETAVARNPDILSAGIRREDGQHRDSPLFHERYLL